MIARQARQSDQLGQREGRVVRASSPEDHHLADGASRQRGPRAQGHVGPRQLVGIGGEDARDVEGDVAGADDDGPLVVEGYGEVLALGMAVVPGHEARSR